MIPPLVKVLVHNERVLKCRLRGRLLEVVVHSACCREEAFHTCRGCGEGMELASHLAQVGKDGLPGLPPGQQIKVCAIIIDGIDLQIRKVFENRYLTCIHTISKHISTYLAQYAQNYYAHHNARTWGSLRYSSTSFICVASTSAGVQEC